MLECFVLLYLSTKSSRTSIYFSVLFAVKYLNIFSVIMRFQRLATEDFSSFFSTVKLYTQLHIFVAKLSAFVSPKLFWFSLWYFENLLERVCDRFSSFVFERKHPTIFWKHVNHCETIPDPAVGLWKCLHFNEVCSPNFINSIHIRFSFRKMFGDGFMKFIS